MDVETITSTIRGFIPQIIASIAAIFVSALFAISIYDIFVYDKTDQPADLCKRYPGIVSPGCFS